ncbi:MAG TPA: hypothetical protein VNI36_06030 [Candidatus Dormibacteraeota bacterium]|nr:hypothetical protein [Candidatus Dormibacteraeota bacterium]
MRARAISGLALIALLAGTTVARADEIRLKDGSQIHGTIVGFENGSFRVATSYGFALIRKDKVADINITASKKEPAPNAKLSAPAMVPAVARQASSPTSPSPETIVLTPMRPETGRITYAAPKSEPPSPRVKALAVAFPAPPPAPPPPEPLVIRDEIRGNTYINLTYGFTMYKPPSWDLIPDARKALPDAVAALGTYDQTTLLVIGRERAKDSLAAHAAATGKALSEVYENYRLASTKHVSIAGLPAIEQHLHGTADGHDWSVFLVTFLKGNNAFTLLGMTWANSDLIQFQENVIAKTLNSLAFTPQ